MHIQYSESKDVTLPIAKEQHWGTGLHIPKQCISSVLMSAKCFQGSSTSYNTIGDSVNILTIILSTQSNTR